MDEEEPFDIFPYVGAGKIKLGMSPKDIEEIYGVADSTMLNHLKQRVEFRSFMNIAYSTGASEAVSHIGFGRQMHGVKLHEVNLFTDPEYLVLKKLLAYDSTPYLYLGFLVFLKLGITLTGFHDNDISQKSVALFSPGAWDKRFEKLKPFKLNN